MKEKIETKVVESEQVSKKRKRGVGFNIEIRNVHFKVHFEYLYDGEITMCYLQTYDYDWDSNEYIGKAKCNLMKNDKADFNVGETIALEKAFVKFRNAQLVCQRRLQREIDEMNKLYEAANPCAFARLKKNQAKSEIENYKLYNRAFEKEVNDKINDKI
jgi:hypothetical protein